MSNQWTALQNFTHYATNPLSDITGGSSSDNMQLPLEPQQALYYCLSHICTSTPQDLQTE